MRRLIIEEVDGGCKITIEGGTCMNGTQLVERHTEAVIKFIADFFDLKDKIISFRKRSESDGQ